jgi:hypothetical protein
LAVGWYFGATLRRAYAIPHWVEIPAAAFAFIGAAIGHLYIYRPILFYLSYALS